MNFDIDKEAEAFTLNDKWNVIPNGFDTLPGKIDHRLALVCKQL